jgi:hypothetical protein
MPSNDRSISRIRKIAPETESAETKKTPVTVAFLGEKRTLSQRGQRGFSGRGTLTKPQVSQPTAPARLFPAIPGEQGRNRPRRSKTTIYQWLATFFGRAAGKMFSLLHRLAGKGQGNHGHLEIIAIFAHRIRILTIHARRHIRQDRGKTTRE